MADIAIPAIVAAPLSATEPAVRWSLWKRMGFRFVCSYWALYCFPGPFASIPGGRFIAFPFTAFWQTLSPLVAIHVFHLTGQATTYFPTGSGDTTLAYIQNLLVVVIALVSTAIWTVLDRKRANYRRLHGWLRLLVRYTLAFILFGYGFAKVFPLQFQPANYSRLMQAYGQFSPMGVLWSFMGASIPYIIFSGAAEVTGGLLLLFRRTATLGALVSCTVLTNVVALNFCYDVPVKLYSSNLLAMAIFLAAGDAKRLVNVFILNRPAPAADLAAPQFHHKWMRTAATVFWVAFAGYQLISQVSSGWQRYQQTYIYPSRQPLNGAYEVDHFRTAGKDALPGDSTRWHTVEFYPQFISIRTVSDSRRGYQANYDATTSSLTLNKRDRLLWSHPDSTHVTLDGYLDGSDVSIGLHQIDLSQFPLNSRGFHWISETPFNR
jgi:hypothetical protein